MSIRVLIVDDQSALRKAIRELLEEGGGVEVTGEADDGSEVLQAVNDAQPDLVLMDLAMPRVNGIKATRQIATTFPGTKVLILSRYCHPQFVKGALDAGAAGFVLKQRVLEDLEEAIHAVGEGQQFISEGVER
jgi:DNA-binding NarL/FixJ family response regulator